MLRRGRRRVTTALDHPLARRGGLSMDELKDEPFAVMSRTVSSLGHDFVWRTAAEPGFTQRVVAVAHIPVLLTLVACGVGISTFGGDMEYIARGLRHSCRCQIWFLCGANIPQIPR